MTVKRYYARHICKRIQVQDKYTTTKHNIKSS